MRTVYRAESIVDAHLVKDALEQQEIPAFIAGEYLQGGVGDLPARDFITVAVPDSCAEPAETIVNGVRETLAEARSVAEERDRRFDDPLLSAS